MKNNISEEHKQQFDEDIYSLDNVIANFEAIANRIDSKIANIDSKLTKLDSYNKEEHKKIFKTC